MARRNGRAGSSPAIGNRKVRPRPIWSSATGSIPTAVSIFARPRSSRSRGFAVTALDLRGRGKSDGERFYAESIDDYVSDLSLAIELGRSKHPELPLYLLGHSAGGVTSVTYALDYQDRIDGLICESFAFRVFAPNFALKLLEGASHLVPARPRAAAQDGGFLARSRVGRAAERRSADRGRGPAGADRRRLCPRRRAVRARVRRGSPCRC